MNNTEQFSCVFIKLDPENQEKALETLRTIKIKENIANQNFNSKDKKLVLNNERININSYKRCRIR